MTQLKKYRPDLEERSKFIVDIFEKYVDKNDTILEIGHGDGRNLDFLVRAGYENVDGIDKAHGTSIEDMKPKQYDVIFSASTFFLIPPDNNWVFEKIAKMAKKYIITVEGETTSTGNSVYGRNYTQVFKPYGFKEVYQQYDVFNIYGVLRVLERCNIQK